MAKTFTINEMRENRAKAWETAKEFLVSHRDDDGMLSAEAVAEYEKMEKKIRDYDAEIARMERARDYDERMASPVVAPLTSRPGSGSQTKTGRASREYKDAMLQALRTNFRNVAGVLQEGIDESGGYLVPDEYDHRLIDVMTEGNIMRQLGTTITTSGQHKINIAAVKPAASWIEEGAAIQFTDASFAQKYLDAHKLHVAIKITEELLYDNAFNLENYIIDQFGKALANSEEDAFLNGDGNGKPTGIFDATAGGTIADTVTKLTGDDLVNLVYALKRPYRKNASFILNDKTLASIRKLKDNTGAYIWQPSYQSGEPDRLLGYEVHTSAYAPLDAISFGDYSYYNIGDRGTRSFQELKELFIGNGMIGFLAKERVDGILVLPEAVQILKIGAGSGSGSGSGSGT